jgi:hypothetical protein
LLSSLHTSTVLGLEPFRKLALASKPLYASLFRIIFEYPYTQRSSKRLNHSVL